VAVSGQSGLVNRQTQRQTTQAEQHVLRFVNRRHFPCIELRPTNQQHAIGYRCKPDAYRKPIHVPAECTCIGARASEMPLTRILAMPWPDWGVESPPNCLHGHPHEADEQNLGTPKYTQLVNYISARKAKFHDESSCPYNFPVTSP